LRFILTYTPADPATNYGHLVVSAVDSKKATALMAKTLNFLNTTLPEVDPRIRAFSKGTGGGAKIQVRFLGSVSDALRDAAEKTLRLMRENPDAINIRTNWGERVKVIRPVLDEARTRQAGLTRQDVAESLNLAYPGNSVGLYREGEKLIPIVLRLPEKERHEGETFPETPVWSPLAGRTVPLSQLTSAIEVLADDPMIYRINRKRALTVECDSRKGKPGELFNILRPGIEGLPLQPGVTLEWGGEYENS
jgi:multidrug efflux pump subunit AcrB